MANGCGPQWMDRWRATKKVKDWTAEKALGWFFNASCNRHDEGYDKGGDWAWKLYCDMRFLDAMLHDSSRLLVHKRIGAIFVALVYFVFVLLGGWFSFTYKAKDYD